MSQPGIPTIDVAEERIAAVRLVVNPDKLAYLRRRLGAPVGELL